MFRTNDNSAKQWELWLIIDLKFLLHSVRHRLLSSNIFFTKLAQNSAYFFYNITCVSHME